MRDGSTEDRPSLLLILHGSRRPGAAVQAEAFRETLARSGRWSRVGKAFIQFGEPGVEEGLEALAGEGARRIVVAPLLVLTGRHCESDIPAYLDAFRSRHPECRVEATTAPLVEHPAFTEMIAVLCDETASRLDDPPDPSASP